VGLSGGEISTLRRFGRIDARTWHMRLVLFVWASEAFCSLFVELRLGLVWVLRLHSRLGITSSKKHLVCLCEWLRNLLPLNQHS
jgi:hypothetical protein